MNKRLKKPFATSKSIIKILFTAGIIFGTTTAFAQSNETNTLKIGVIGPFSGASADFGVPMLNGIQMAVDEINAVGGYSGRKLEIIRKDDEAKPDVGLKLSNELVAEKVAATIGLCFSNQQASFDYSLCNRDTTNDKIPSGRKLYF
jgi:branched-chain amino acid transport system substrate-binding protein